MIVAQRARIRRIMPEHGEGVAVLVQTRKTIVDSTDPERAVVIFADRANARIAYFGGAHPLSIGDEAARLRVITAQAPVGTYPNPALVIRVKRTDRI